MARRAIKNIPAQALTTYCPPLLTLQVQTLEIASPHLTCWLSHQLLHSGRSTSSFLLLLPLSVLSTPGTTFLCDGHLRIEARQHSTQSIAEPCKLPVPARNHALQIWRWARLIQLSWLEYAETSHPRCCEGAAARPGANLSRVCGAFETVLWAGGGGAAERYEGSEFVVIFGGRGYPGPAGWCICGSNNCVSWNGLRGEVGFNC